MWRHYVYVHKKADTGEVFYVGKGTLKRRYGKPEFARLQPSVGRSGFWHRVVTKHGFVGEVVMMCLNDAEAQFQEKALISAFGRRNTGRGPLVNLTDGGEGHAGIIVSEAYRQLMRERVRGERHPNWGRRLSADTCQKKSRSMKASPHNLKGKTLPERWRQRIAAGKMGSRNPFFGKPTPMSRSVVDTANGMVYPSLARAAIALSFKYQTLYNMLTGHRSNRTALRFA